MFFNPFKSKIIQQNIEATHDKWKEDYERIFLQMCHEVLTFDGSFPCAYARGKGLGEPHHPNCWVSMLTQMRKKGYITRATEDGRRLMMVSGSQKHCHNNFIGMWESNLFTGDV